MLIRGIRILGHVHRHGRYLCTRPLSGTDYIACILNSAVDIEMGQTGEYHYVEGINESGQGDWVHDNIRLHYSASPNQFWSKLASWPSRPLGTYVFLLSHQPTSRGIFDPSQMKPVFSVRNLFDQLGSWLFQQGYDQEKQDQFIQKGYVEQVIDFLNYWGDFMTNIAKVPSEDYALIRYEDLIADPLEP